MKVIKVIRVFAVTFFVILLTFPAVNFAMEDLRKAELSENQQFKLASQLYSAKADKKAAMLEFKRFLAQYPASRRADQALFMIAESTFQLALMASGWTNPDWPKTEEASALQPEAGATLPPSIEEGTITPAFTFDNAIQAYQDFLADYPVGELAESAQYRIGECWYNEKNYIKSILAFKKLIEEHPKTFLKPEILYGLGTCYIALEKWDEADRCFQNIQKLYPVYLTLDRILFPVGLVYFHDEKYEQSLAKFQAMKQKDAVVYYYMGRCLAKMEQYLKAISQFKTVVKNYPDSNFVEDCQYMIGQCFYDAKDYFAAVKEYNAFINTFPGSQIKPDAFYQVGCSYYNQDLYNDAMKAFTAVTVDYTTHELAPLSHYMNGESYRQLNQDNDATFSYAKVLTDYPQSAIAVYAQYKIGWAYTRQKSYDTAVNEFEKVIKNYPNSDLVLPAYYLKGNNLYWQAKYADAVAAYQAILDRSGYNELAEAALGMINMCYYPQQNYSQIITNYNYLLNAFPPSQSRWRRVTLLYVADAYYRSQLFEKANAVYDLILINYPSFDEAVYAQDGKGWCLSKEDKFDQALEEHQKAAASIDDATKELNEKPKETQTEADKENTKIKDTMKLYTMMEKINALYNNKQYEKAVWEYESFVKNNPDSPLAPEAQYMKAMCYFRAEYYADAIKAWSELIEKYPNGSRVKQAYEQMADTNFRARKTDDAIRNYEDIMKKYPGTDLYKLAMLRIGQSYYNDRKYDDAIPKLEAFMNAYPDDEKSIEALRFIVTISAKKKESVPQQAGPDGKPLPPPIDAPYVEMLRKFVAAYPKSVAAGEAQYNLGYEYFHAEKYEDSIKEYQKCYIDYPRTESVPLAMFELGESYYRLKQYKEAAEAHTRFVTNFPDNLNVPGALYHIATACFFAEEYDKSVKANDVLYNNSKARAEYGKNIFINKLAALRKLKKWEETAGVYQQLLNEYPLKEEDKDKPEEVKQRQDWELEIPQLYMDAKNYRRAAVEYENLFKRIPAGDERGPEILTQTGACYTKLGEMNKAESVYLKLLEINPKGTDMWVKGLADLAQYYEKKKRLKDTLQIYRNIVAANPEDKYKSVINDRIKEVEEMINSESAAPAPAAPAAPAPAAPAAPAPAVPAAPAPAAPAAPGQNK